MSSCFHPRALVENDSLKAAARVQVELGGGGRPVTARERYAGTAHDASLPLAERKLDPNGPYAIVRCATEKLAREAHEILRAWGYEGETGNGTEGAQESLYAYRVRAPRER